MPEHTIVQLSGNYAGYTDDFILNDIEKTAQFITGNGSNCVWVGPADSRDRSRIPRLKNLFKKQPLHTATFFGVTRSQNTLNLAVMVFIIREKKALGRQKFGQTQFLITLLKLNKSLLNVEMLV